MDFKEREREGGREKKRQRKQKRVEGGIKRNANSTIMIAYVSKTS